jgi:hypothetical protein
MTKRVVATWVVIPIGTSLVLIGMCALVVPDFAARSYGVPSDSDATRAFVRAAGTRDIAIGGWLLSLLALQVGSRVLGISFLVLTVIPASDLLIVATARSGGNTGALALHGSAILVLPALGCWLLRDGRRTKGTVTPPDERTLQVGGDGTGLSEPGPFNRQTATQDPA